jgi:hypothetical protein
MNTKLNAGCPALAMVTRLLLKPMVAAAESPLWHLWKNRFDGTTQCAQSVPGRGWDNLDSTFSDGRCQTAVNGFAGNAASETGRKKRILELMTIIVATRSGR